MRVRVWQWGGSGGRTFAFPWLRVPVYENGNAFDFLLHVSQSLSSSTHLMPFITASIPVRLRKLTFKIAERAPFGEDVLSGSYTAAS